MTEERVVGEPQARASIAVWVEVEVLLCDLRVCAVFQHRGNRGVHRRLHRRLVLAQAYARARD